MFRGGYGAILRCAGLITLLCVSGAVGHAWSQGETTGTSSTRQAARAQPFVREAPEPWEATLLDALLLASRYVPPVLRPPLVTLGDWAVTPDGKQHGLVLVGVLVLAWIALRWRNGPGDLAVAIAYPGELRGTFSVHVSRRKPRLDTTLRSRWQRTNRPSTPRDHYLVSRETRFSRLLPRRYWVVIHGTLEDALTARTIGEYTETQRISVGRRTTQRCEFDLRPRGCPVEVRVLWERQPADEACAAARGQPGSIRYARGGVIRMELPLGAQRLAIGSRDRVVVRSIDLASYQTYRLSVDFTSAEDLLFRGCPPAVESYVQGDSEGAARALERDGQTDVAHVLRAEACAAQGETERAAQHYESAGKLRQAADLRAELDDPIGAAELLARSADAADRSRARQILEELRDPLASDSRGRVLLAELLAEQGERGRARGVIDAIDAASPLDSSFQARVLSLRQRLAPEPTTTESAPEPRSSGGRYDILEQIGAGGMGVVFRARDKRLGRLVALKQVPENLREHPTAVELFRREARAVAALNHPNIVTLYDADDEDGKLILTMELLEGQPLHRILKREGPIPASRCARIGAQVASGLHYAHTRGIVHRDIKTANLFWSQDHLVKIMDFGLAKMQEEVRRSSTVIGGTPYYMAPEQAAGESVGPPADLYALGVTLFEILTGKLPFPDGDIAMHHRDTAPPDPRMRLPSLPDAFAVLILQLLEKSPERRPASAELVASRLTQLAQ